MWISSSIGFLLVLIVIIVAVVLQARMVPPSPNGIDSKLDKSSKKPSLFGDDFFNDLGSRDLGSF